MSDIKPNPSIDENGDAWCYPGCPALVGDSILNHCDITGKTDTTGDICEPYSSKEYLPEPPDANW